MDEFIKCPEQHRAPGCGIAKGLGVLRSGQPRSSPSFTIFAHGHNYYTSLSGTRPMWTTGTIGPSTKIVLVPKANFLKVKNMALIPIKSEHVPKSHVIQ